MTLAFQIVCFVMINSAVYDDRISINFQIHNNVPPYFLCAASLSCHACLPFPDSYCNMRYKWVEMRPISSQSVSPHFSHTCSGALFLLLQNISFPEWGWNISFCFSDLLTLLTKSLLTHLRSQIYCSGLDTVNCVFLKPLFDLQYLT